MQGLNAARQVTGLDYWTPRRDEAYIGVMIDDLITRGTREPYRMFTSRAEYRLMLREDNADLRLTEQGRNLGLVDDVRWQAFNNKAEAITTLQSQIKTVWIRPDTEQANTLSAQTGLTLSRERRLNELLKMPEINLQAALELLAPELSNLDKQVVEQVEIQGKYAGYLDRQQAEIDKSRTQTDTRLPQDLDYTKVRSLSNEIAEKLNSHKPETIGQASRISGVTPSCYLDIASAPKKTNTARIGINAFFLLSLRLYVFISFSIARLTTKGAYTSIY